MTSITASKLTLVLTLLAGLSGPAAPASAQAAQLPSCAELGLTRLAVVIPPDQTAPELRASLGVSAESDEVALLTASEAPTLQNAQEMSRSIRSMLQPYLDRGLALTGSATALLQISDEGRVTKVHVSTGDFQLDRALSRVWKRARFTPVSVRGCRPSVWLRVPITFMPSADRQEIYSHVRTPA